MKVSTILKQQNNTPADDKIKKKKKKPFKFHMQNE